MPRRGPIPYGIRPAHSPIASQYGPLEYIKSYRNGQMFARTDDFNQPLDKWNVSHVTTMQQMFDHAGAFDKDISSWNLSDTVNVQDMFLGASISCELYNKIVRTWKKGDLGRGSGCLKDEPDQQ